MARSSETKYTAGGQEYNRTVGTDRNDAQEITVGTDGKTWYVPASDIIGQDQDFARALISATISKGPLSETEVSELSSKYGVVNKSQLFGWYQTIIDENKNNLGYDSSIYLTDTGMPNYSVNEKFINSETGKFDANLFTETNTSNTNTYNPIADYNSMVEAAYQDRLGLMTDPTGANAQRFRDTMYGAIAEEQAIAEQSLGQAELDAYRMLGQQQLELENTIAEQRKKALVSGTTSAQLAAGQLQNMFAAQSGAAQVAQSLANQRTQMNQAFAEKRTGVETSLYDYINQQQTIAATAGAQNLAALSSYASYANKNYNDVNSLYTALQGKTTSEKKTLYEWMYGKENK